MNRSQKGKEINGSWISKEKRGQEKIQRRTEAGYEKVEYSLVFKRDTCKGKEFEKK